MNTMLYWVLDVTRMLHPWNLNIMIIYTRPACNSYTSQHANMGGTKFHKATGNQWMLRGSQFSSQKSPLFRTVSCRHLYMWATLIGLCVYMHICRYVCIITIITAEEVMIQEEVGSRRSLTEEKKGWRLSNCSLLIYEILK